jgi:hypothetical protein
MVFGRFSKACQGYISRDFEYLSVDGEKRKTLLEFVGRILGPLFLSGSTQNVFYILYLLARFFVSSLDFFFEKLG